MPPELSEPQKESVRQIANHQIGLEILLKHQELRLIDQELAKCQIALEQLRRCSEIPYPVMQGAESVRLGTGCAVRRPGLRPQARSPAPWGVTDGPYTRHYAQWLLPDPRFDGGEVESLGVHSGKYPANGRSTRGSFVESSRNEVKANKQIATGPGLRTGTSASHKPGPTLLKRKSDGATVKLVCLDCGRSDFGSPQGFINHCRIQHQRNFASHDAAAEACGEAVQVDEAGAVVGQEPVSTPSTNLVHPLIRSARAIPSAIVPGPALSVDRTSSVRSKIISASPDFNPSSTTPNLSVLIQKQGLGLNLQDIVQDAQMKVEMPESESEPDEEESDVGMPFQMHARGRHPLVAGSKHPARSHMSPMPSPEIARATLASVQRPQPSALWGDATSSLHATSQQEAGAMNMDLDNSINLLGDGLEPSPTSEIHQAPSLVDDDGECDEIHSPPSSPLPGDDAGSVDFEIRDEERGHGDEADLRVPRFHADYHKQPGIPEAGPASGRISSPTISPRVGRKTERHVSFVNLSPAVAVSAESEKNTDESARKRKRRKMSRA